MKLIVVFGLRIETRKWKCILYVQVCELMVRDLPLSGSHHIKSALGYIRDTKPDFWIVGFNENFGNTFSSKKLQHEYVTAYKTDVE